MKVNSDVLKIRQHADQSNPSYRTFPLQPSDLIHKHQNFAKWEPLKTKERYLVKNAGATRRTKSRIAWNGKTRSEWTCLFMVNQSALTWWSISQSRWTDSASHNRDGCRAMDPGVWDLPSSRLTLLEETFQWLSGSKKQLKSRQISQSKQS